MNTSTAILPRLSGSCASDDLYFNPIPMRRPDYRAKKHGKPMPVRYRRIRSEKECEL